MSGWSLVEAVAGSSGDPPNAVTMTQEVNVGDVLYAVVTSVGNGVIGTVSATDTLLNTWTSRASYDDATNSSSVRILRCIAANAGIPVITFSEGTAEYGDAVVAHFSRNAGTVTADAGAATTAGGNSATPTDTPVTNAQAGEILICGAALNFGWTSAPAGWTGAATTQTGLYYALPASASLNTPFSGTLGGSAIWDVATIGDYIVAAAGGGTSDPNSLSPGSESIGLCL